MESNTSLETMEKNQSRETQTEGASGELIDKFKRENDDLKSKLDVVNDQIDAVSRYSRPGLPSSQE